MSFKIGDKLRVIYDHDTWLKGVVDNDSILTVVEDDDGDNYVNTDALTIEFTATSYHSEDFMKVEEPVEEPRFSVDMETQDIGDKYFPTEYFPTDVKLSEGVLIVPEPLGVFRPKLEDRKVGKVRVELVDDGFPLALREIAKVMTWAQDAKGYKDHDWQNLPNAEMALAAAASRHRTDHIKQRMVDGLFIKQCVDGESELLHKAHEAFGVLAQLELMLRGDIE